MKRILFASFVTLIASGISAQTVKNMNDLTPEQKSMAVSLKLTGELSTEGNSDYRQLRRRVMQYVVRQPKMMEPVIKVMSKARNYIRKLFTPFNI